MRLEPAWFLIEKGYVYPVHGHMENRDFANILCLPLALASAVLLASCSTQDVVNVALSKDPEHAVESLARARAETYKRNPQRIVADTRRAKHQLEQLIALLKGEVSQTWGNDEIVLPGNKRYVKYTQAYKSRAIVNFDTGQIIVETVAQDEPEKHLEQAIITTLLTPDDPRSVDLYSDRQIKLSGRPYLFGLVKDNKGRSVTTPDSAEKYASFLVGHEKKTRKTSRGGMVQYVQMHMLADHINRQAQYYEPLVEKHAKRFMVSKSLVFAVIKTESAFNPFAVSTAPAYGLMQLVPSSGGRDAYRAIKGQDRIPDKEYLFDSNNNIELGTAYLHLLNTRYLGEINNPISREYCTIAAYNGGSGNVLRVFSKNRKNAIAIINRLSPAAVFKKLRHQHARLETRRYLAKVITARKEFVNL